MKKSTLGHEPLLFKVTYSLEISRLDNMALFVMWKDVHHATKFLRTKDYIRFMIKYLIRSTKAFISNELQVGTRRLPKRNP